MHICKVRDECGKRNDELLAEVAALKAEVAMVREALARSDVGHVTLANARVFEERGRCVVALENAAEDEDLCSCGKRVLEAARKEILGGD